MKIAKANRQKPAPSFNGRVNRVFENARDFYLFLWDSEEKSCTVWPDISDMYNFKNGVSGQSLVSIVRSVVHPADEPLLFNIFSSLLGGEENGCSARFRLVTKQGGIQWVQGEFQVRKQENGYPALIGGSITNVRQEALTQTHLFADYATGFCDGQQGCIMLFDVDDFKFITDSMEHAFATKLLELLVQALSETIDQRLYRLDEDRYAAVLYGKSRAEISRLYDAVSARFRDLCGRLREGAACTLSCGVARFPQDSMYIRDLHSYVNSAVSTAKQAGKNTIVFFELEEYSRFEARQAMWADLRRCVHEGFEGFSLHFQPQVDMKKGNVPCAEVLLRWNSAERGVVPPDEFIPLLERSGLIVEVGRWVLDRALAQCALWRKQEPDFMVSVNLSYAQLKRDNFFAYVAESLSRYGLPGTALVLEITETQQMEDIELFNAAMRPLAAMGVTVAIDDFGTGYSSLGYFKNLHVNFLKIDRSFIARILESEYDFRLIQFVITLAHKAGLAVCVEGVETAEELRALLPLGPDYIQGFYFGRPVPAPEYERLYLGRRFITDMLANRIEEQVTAPAADTSAAEHCVALCLRRMAARPTREECVDVLLAGLGEHYKALCVTLLGMAPDGKLIMKMQSWSHSQFINQDIFIDNGFEQNFPHLNARFLQNAAVLIDEQNGAARSYPEEYELMSRFGVRCILAAPVYHEGCLIGGLIIEEPKAYASDDTAAMLMAPIIAAQIHPTKYTAPQAKPKKAKQV